MTYKQETIKPYNDNEAKGKQVEQMFDKAGAMNWVTKKDCPRQSFFVIFSSTTASSRRCSLHRRRGSGSW